MPWHKWVDKFENLLYALHIGEDKKNKAISFVMLGTKLTIFTTDLQVRKREMVQDVLTEYENKTLPQRISHSKKCSNDDRPCKAQKKV